MNSRPLFLLFSILPFLLRSTPASADPLAPAPSPYTADSDFIFQTCKLTLYPDLCYTSLSRSAASVRHTSSEIARAALTVCLSQARFTSAYLSNLTRHNSDSDSSFSALRDCSSTLSSAVSQIRDSLKQITELLAGERQIRFEVSNVQTWMSAAITNEDTCTDGFQSVPDGPLKSDVSDHVALVRKLTSNALALVDFYVSTLG